MKKMDEFIMKHPHFVHREEQEKQVKYIFQDANTQHYLGVDRQFNSYNDFPVVFSSMLEKDHWMRELAKEANELYFTVNRLRMLVANEKRSIFNILYFSSLNEAAIEMLRFKIMGSKIVRLKGKWIGEFKKIEPILKKEGYQIHVLNKKETKFMDITIQ